MRMARGSAKRSHEVQSEAPCVVTPELNHLARLQITQSMLETMDKRHAATDPLYKMMLKDAIDNLRRDLGMPPLPSGGAGAAFVEAWGCFFLLVNYVFFKK